MFFANIRCFSLVFLLFFTSHTPTIHVCLVYGVYNNAPQIIFNRFDQLNNHMITTHHRMRAPELVAESHTPTHTSQLYRAQLLDPPASNAIMFNGDMLINHADHGSQLLSGPPLHQHHNSNQGPVPRLDRHITQPTTDLTLLPAGLIRESHTRGSRIQGINDTQVLLLMWHVQARWLYFQLDQLGAPVTPQPVDASDALNHTGSGQVPHLYHLEASDNPWCLDRLNTQLSRVMVCSWCTSVSLEDWTSRWSWS